MKILLDSVNIAHKRLKRLPMKPDGTYLFDDVHVHAHFLINSNELTSLVGSPAIVNGEFNCSWNFLETLEGAPRRVGAFLCQFNLIQNLKGSPEQVEGDFVCRDCELYSLEGATKVVYGNFFCAGNNRTFSKSDVSEVCDVRGRIYV